MIGTDESIVVPGPVIDHRAVQVGLDLRQRISRSTNTPAATCSPAESTSGVYRSDSSQRGPVMRPNAIGYSETLDASTRCCWTLPLGLRNSDAAADEEPSRCSQNRSAPHLHQEHKGNPAERRGFLF